MSTIEEGFTPEKGLTHNMDEYPTGFVSHMGFTFDPEKLPTLPLIVQKTCLITNTKSIVDSNGVTFIRDEDLVYRCV